MPNGIHQLAWVSTNQWRVPLYPFVFLAALRTNLYDDNWGLSPPKLFMYKISFRSYKYLWKLLLSYFADVEIKAHTSLERQKSSDLSLELLNFPPYMKWKLMWILKRTYSGLHKQFHCLEPLLQDEYKELWHLRTTDCSLCDFEYIKLNKRCNIGVQNANHRFTVFLPTSLHGKFCSKCF